MGTTLEHGELMARLGLRLVPGVGNVLFPRLLDRFGSAERVFAAGQAELESVDRLSPTVAGNIRARRFKTDPEDEWAALEKRGWRLIFFDGPEYPFRLEKIHNPPAMLYVWGELDGADSRAVAVVGPRYPSREGLTLAGDLAAGLAEAGVTVVSGLARGIDSAAHRAALSAGGRTIAVLGCGLDVEYPPENRDLKRSVAAKGAVLTEYPLGSEPEPGHFPVRNRIISGLSLGVCVVEAPERSGALITARLALDEGREVFAGRGPGGSPRHSGSNRLIEEGATPVETAADIFREIEPQMGGRPVSDRKPKPKAEKPVIDDKPKEAPPPLEPDQREVLDLVGAEPIHIDLIVRRAGLSAAAAAVILLDLELTGLIRQLPGKLYVRSK